MSNNLQATTAKPDKSTNIISTAMGSVTHDYTKIVMQSAILGEERELLIHLPKGYNKGKKHYPVVFLLDGKRHLPHAIAASNILQAESLMPHSIIVGISNMRGTRRRDLSDGRDNFIGFIKDEVFSLVTEQYRVTEHKTLFGHSMAGAFTMYLLATQSNMFDNYIAASPVMQINDAEVITKYKVLDSLKVEKPLYFTFGNPVAEGKNRADALNQFVALMQQKTPKNLSWQYDALPNQVHMTTPYLTLYAGLTYVFADYQTPVYSSLKDYEQRGKLQGLKDYYVKRADKYSASADIPENALRNLGFAIFDDGYSDQGLEILKLNVQQYPNSIRALNALAQTYEDVLKPAHALEIYKQAVNVAKKQSSRNLAHFERQVDRLEGYTD